MASRPRPQVVAALPELDVAQLRKSLKAAMSNRGPDGTRVPVTQTQVVEQTGVHKGTLADLLNHGYAPSLPDVVRLMRWLRMEPGEFWRDPPAAGTPAVTDAA